MTTRDTDATEVPVWDRFVRCFHWATVALFATAFLSPEVKFLHEPVGYALLALTIARIIWGFVGTLNARFSSFVAGPTAVLTYLRLLGRGHAPRHLGHNPAGGAMIIALLTLLIATGASGWMSATDRWFGVEWVEEVHEISANLMLGLVVVHVLAVVLSSLAHRENLVRAMITGRKAASGSDHPR